MVSRGQANDDPFILSLSGCSQRLSIHPSIYTHALFGGQEIPPMHARFPDASGRSVLSHLYPICNDNNQTMRSVFFPFTTRSGCSGLINFFSSGILFCHHSGYWGYSSSSSLCLLSSLSDVKKNRSCRRRRLLRTEAQVGGRAGALRGICLDPFHGLLLLSRPSPIHCPGAGRGGREGGR
jgi:hypothetical protein